MTTAFQFFAVLGILWSIAVAWLMMAVQDTWTRGAGFALLLLTMMLTVFGRFFALRQWAAIAVCLYCAWTTVSSVSSGIWQWTLGWCLVTITLIVLTWTNWQTLRPGV